MMLDNPYTGALEDDLELQAPAGYVMCSVLGLDYHASSAKFYATANMRREDDDDCWDIYEEWERWLITVEPLTGEIEMIGQLPFYVGSLAVLGDGRVVIISSSNSPDNGAIFELSKEDATPTLLVSPTSRTPQSELAYRADTNELYYFNSRQQLLSIFNPTTWSETVLALSPPNTSRVYGGIAHYEDGVFFGTDWNYSSRVLVLWEPDGAGGYESNYQMNQQEPFTRGMVLSSFHDGSGSCATGDVFRCVLPSVVPWGGWVVPMEVDLDASTTGLHTVQAAVGGVATSVDVQIIAPDLTVTASPNGARFLGGNSVVYSATVKNAGDRGATGSVMTFSYPSNLTYSTYSTSQGSCSNVSGLVTCNLGTINVNSSVNITLTFTAGTNGGVDTTAQVSTTRAEANLGNNEATQRNVIGPAVDVQASVFPNPLTVAPGATTQVTVTLTNAGPDAAASMTVLVTFPDGWTLTERPADCDKPDIENQSRCTASSLSVNGTKEFVFGLTAPKAGGLGFFRVYAQTATPDLKVNNNSVSAQFGVYPPSLMVSLGSAVPANGSTISASKAVFQVKLTHGGETDQALVVRGLTVTANSMTLVNDLLSLPLIVFDDADGNGLMGSNETRLTTAGLTRNANGVELRFDTPVSVTTGQVRTIGIRVVPSLGQLAAATGPIGRTAFGFMSAASFAPFVLVGALVFGRRKSVLMILMAMALTGSGMALSGCGDEPTASGASVRITLISVDASLASGEAPAVPLPGLPLVGPKVTIE